jgi:hypothetical protein
MSNLPAHGQLLKGMSVPVVHKKYKGTCSVLFYSNKTENGLCWPFFRFASFKHGGIERSFNGLEWLNKHKRISIPKSYTSIGLKVNKLETTGNLPNNTVTTSFDETTENNIKLARHNELTDSFNQGQSLLISDHWLVKRLAGYCTKALLQRIVVKRHKHNLLFPLSHCKHGTTGFHKIVNKKQGDKKFHFSKKNGTFKGSYICIKGKNNFEHLPIALCEGVATGLSIALVWPGEVRIALSANNLVSVRQGFSKQAVFFYDEDLWKPRVGNVGLTSALSAMQEKDMKIPPKFNPQCIDEEPTDFNDLLVLQGIEELSKQIGKVLQSI